MKLAHLADLHLGFRQYHRQTQSGLNQREADVARAFRSAVDGVIAERPDAILVAGDLFHSVRPTNPAILFAFSQFQRLREALPTAPIIVIAGNHDTPRSTEAGWILKLLETLDVAVVTDAARRLVYPELDLSVLAVPHAALFSPERPSLRPEGKERRQVLMLHGEVEGVFPTDRTAVEYGGARLQPADLTSGGWSYVALGHYHVQHEVAPRVWYSGALEYVSPNPWGELKDEAAHRVGGKGWLLVDPDAGTVESRPVARARRVMDLEPIDGKDQPAAALDGLIAARIKAVPGGITDQVVRLVVKNVPGHVDREINYTAIRAFKAEALHFNLDLRGPQIHRKVGIGSPGRRETLPHLVEEYLASRLLPGEIDRAALVRLGVDLITAVERDWAER